MTNQVHTFQPDHSTPPGDLIQEYLDELGISARELARRCGRSGKLISEIIAGKAPVEPETALQLERVLEVSASVWMNMEAAYRLHVARASEDQSLAVSYEWAKVFPIKELAERRCLQKFSDHPNQVREILTFFGVGSVKACEEKIADLLQVDFRTSPKFDADRPALAAWLRIGEKRAASIEADSYDKDVFLRTLRDLRKLTCVPLDKALPEIERRCAAAGVVFVLEKALPKTRASGASRWLSPRKALIQQSARYLTGDHFWFTFFHECAHLLLHSRKEIFIDVHSGPGSANPQQEAEANLWAADFLVPSAAMKKFQETFSGDGAEVVEFASKCGIAPGIVVGQLQHNGALGHHALNHLKERLGWKSE
ncbi:addiction module antidote protein, HigA family [Mesorhizobium hawassense]|uniref:Addiction module antidote protein, HigA family n=1 Tax=Mesorhizobium hawassense TaxID=1209954 RepID=A0A330HYT9_9HYPH|nr:HigA family addiction module antitoxin [Mesorhizobium hawassense]RAZ92862.1 addiction module antidote protein, HigA family [Mesorhizobium hawassense]